MFKRVFAFIATIDHIKYNLRLVFTRQVSETDNVFFSMQKSLHYCLVYSSASKGLDNNWITDLLNTFPTDRPSFSAFRRERFFACKNFSERPWALQAGERERGRSERGLALLKINKCRTSGKPLPDSSQIFPRAEKLVSGTRSAGDEAYLHAINISSSLSCFSSRVLVKN